MKKLFLEINNDDTVITIMDKQKCESVMSQNSRLNSNSIHFKNNFIFDYKSHSYPYLHSNVLKKATKNCEH